MNPPGLSAAGSRLPFHAPGRGLVNHGPKDAQVRLRHGFPSGQLWAASYFSNIAGGGTGWVLQLLADHTPERASSLLKPLAGFQNLMRGAACADG